MCVAIIPRLNYSGQDYKERERLGAYHSLSVKERERFRAQELCESRWPSWAVRPNEPYGFRGRKAILNHAHPLVSACP